MKTNYENLVVIWMITYNHENYISQAIESILIQKTKFQYKLIIGEDYSTDNTGSICQEYALKYPEKIHLIQQTENIGVSQNAQFVFSACLESRAKYIAMLEGDDYWTDPYKLQKQVDLMEKHPIASMCVGLNIQYNMNTFEFNKDEKYKSANFPLLDLNELKQYFHTSTYLISRSYFEILFKKYALLINGDTSLRYMLLSCGPFVVLNEYVSVYRITGNGIWTKTSNVIKHLANYKIYNSLRKNFIVEQKNHHLNNEIYYLRLVIDTLKEENKFSIKLCQYFIKYKLLQIKIFFKII